jgi:SDR family mycofactocin-dependent oxidoreductase
VRVALVTGAARGIGAATVRALSDDGYAVLAVDWCAGADAIPYAMPTREDLDRLVDGRENVDAYVADVRSRNELEHAVAYGMKRWGRLDAVVAAAAVIDGGQVMWETPEEVLDLQWEINVRGVWNTAAVSLPIMLSGPEPSGCRFVAIASAAGTHGLFNLAAYNAAKHAVVGIVKGLAADLVGTGISAVAVSPGSTDTPMLKATAALYSDASVDDLVGHQLLGRMIQPEEIAATISFCCSAAGAVLNGSVVHADGGFKA